MDDMLKQLKISVIIPTYNRAELLKSSLKSLTKQSIPKAQFEIIIVDDGSKDNTEEICRNFQEQLQLKYFKQKNSGIAAAKNLGIFVSNAPILLFFDDDDVADTNLLKEHIKTHNKNPEENIAVLGCTTWHKNLQLTQVMNYITNIGHFLFSYTN